MSQLSLQSITPMHLNVFPNLSNGDFNNTPVSETCSMATSRIVNYCGSFLKLTFSFDLGTHHQAPHLISVLGWRSDHKQNRWAPRWPDPRRWDCHTFFGRNWSRAKNLAGSGIFMDGLIYLKILSLLYPSYPVDRIMTCWYPVDRICPAPNTQGGSMSQGTRRYHNPWSCQCPSLGSNSTSWKSLESFAVGRWSSDDFIKFRSRLKNGKKSWCPNCIVYLFHD